MEVLHAHSNWSFGKQRPLKQLKMWLKRCCLQRQLASGPAEQRGAGTCFLPTAIPLKSDLVLLLPCSHRRPKKPEDMSVIIWRLYKISGKRAGWIRSGYNQICSELAGVIRCHPDVWWVQPDVNKPWCSWLSSLDLLWQQASLHQKKPLAYWNDCLQIHLQCLREQFAIWCPVIMCHCAEAIMRIPWSSGENQWELVAQHSNCAVATPICAVRG